MKKTFLSIMIIGLITGSAANAFNRESGGMMTAPALFIDFGKALNSEQAKAFKAYSDYVKVAQQKGQLKELNQTQMSGSKNILTCVRFKDYWESLTFVARLKEWQQEYKSFDVYAGPNCSDFSQANLADLNKTRSSRPL